MPARGGGGANEEGLAGADENAAASGGECPCACMEAGDPVRGSPGEATGGTNKEGLAGADENAAASGSECPCECVEAGDPVRGSPDEATGCTLGPRVVEEAPGA